MKNGLFITFEGIDGCGKSTQLAKTVEYLKEKNINHIVTREPGGTPIGEKIRNLILSLNNSEMKNSCELLLYLAARSQHVEEKIKPALKNDFIVLCDRFQDATFAYQGFGRGYSLNILKQLNNFASDLLPSKTFLIDINVECAFERLKKSGKKGDRLENNSINFFNKIREGYLTLASSNPSRIKILQGEKSIQEIFDVIRREIDLLL